MAVKASASISIWDVVDIKSVTWYYKLQSSTATAPAKPTTATPSGWTTTEPTYTAGSTNTLYITCKVLFSDGTFAYSDVSKSSSYEAAKVAYNKAQNADNKVNNQMKYFWKDDEGIHVAVDQNCAGNNVLITDSDIQVRYGTTTLATFSKNLINLGDTTDSEYAYINLLKGLGKISIEDFQASNFAKALTITAKEGPISGVGAMVISHGEADLLTDEPEKVNAPYLFLFANPEEFVGTEEDSEAKLVADKINLYAAKEFNLKAKSILLNGLDSNEIMTKDAVIREDITLKGTGYNFQYIALKSGYELIDAKTHSTGTSNTIIGIQYNPTSKVYAVIFNNNVSTSTTLTVRCTWLKVE